MRQAVESVSSSQALSCNGTQPIISTPTEGRSRLVFGEDERVANWVRERLPNFLGWNGHYVAIGYERKRLCGGVVFTQYSGANIVIACALEAALTRRFLRAIFYYPFLQLKCRRVTALIDDDNLRSCRLVESAGFEFEGRMKHATETGDVLIYGLLRERCRWLG
jgi:RimJ/RimL family protein N-acetyltransferase